MTLPILQSAAFRAGLIGAILALVFAAGFATSSYMESKRRLAEQVDEQRRILAWLERSHERAAAIETQQVQVVERIRTVFRDRVKEVVRNVEANREMDSRCTVPARFVELWNSANQMRPANPAAVADEAPSGVALSDVAAQHDAESEAHLACIEQVKGWQAFYRSLQETQK